METKKGEGWPKRENVTIPHEVRREATRHTHPRTMIRFFSEEINPIFLKPSIIETIQAALAAFDPQQNRCPNCGASHHWRYHSVYHKSLTEYNGCLSDQEVTILRYKCLSCGKTHAVIPSPMIPYARYSLNFMCHVLLTYSQRNKLGLSVQAVAEKFGIAISTLYEWKARVQKQIGLFLGALRSQRISLAAFVRFIGSWRNLAQGLRLFFETYGFSFLQRQPGNTTRTNLQTRGERQVHATSTKPEWIQHPHSVKLESTSKKEGDSNGQHETSARPGPIPVLPDCSNHPMHTGGRVDRGLLPPSRGQPDPPT
jgi:transposase-like protein